MRLSHVCAAVALLFTGERDGRAGVGTTWITERPTLTERSGVFDARLRESSGAAASHERPGLLWTLEDSGAEPALHLVSPAARLEHTAVLDAVNFDWEALALGPCGRETCVYVGDIGDNLDQRTSVALLRVPERRLLAPGAAVIAVERLEVRYPDGPQDAEAIVVTPGGSVLLLTKGRTKPPRQYRVDAAAWRRRGASGPVTATPLGELPIGAGGVLGRWITDATLTADGRHAVVRTYRDLFHFRRDSDDRLVPAEPPVVCDISALEPQGEGVTWMDDSTLVLTSEAAFGFAGMIHRVRCPSLRARDAGR